MLGPILFNVFINDIFIIFDGKTICNFADDNTPYVCGPSLDYVIKSLQNTLSDVLKWCKYNSLVANPAKFQFILPGSPNIDISIEVNCQCITNSKVVKLLGILIDDKLTFYPHIQDLSKKAGNKIKALLRIRNLLSQSRSDILFNSFICSYFNYCPLVWMFCSKPAHDLLDKVHFRSLKARFLCFQTSFEDLLHRANSVTIHDRNLTLAV